MMRLLRKLGMLPLASVAVMAVYAQDKASGIRYATDFGQWNIPQGNTPINGVISWPVAALCAPVSNGVTIHPIRVGRRVRIVDVNPALSETVTITSARDTGPSCTMSALMQYSHTSYSIASGTAGLQEAVDSIDGSQAGAVVVVTPGWVALGGTSSMIISATGSPSISVLDMRTASLVPYLWSGTGYVASPFSGGGGGGVVVPPSLAFLGSNASGQVTASTYVPVNQAGDTMTGPLLLSADPVSPMGAATRQYVLSQVVNQIPAGTGFVKQSGTTTSVGALTASDVNAVGTITNNTTGSAATAASATFANSANTAANVPASGITGSSLPANINSAPGLSVNPNQIPGLAASA